MRTDSGQERETRDPTRSEISQFLYLGFLSLPATLRVFLVTCVELCNCANLYQAIWMWFFSDQVSQSESWYSIMQTSGGILNFCFLLTVNTRELRSEGWGWQINNQSSELISLLSCSEWRVESVQWWERREVAGKETICRVVAGQSRNTITVTVLHSRLQTTHLSTIMP